jgi:hypothetical protein
MRVPSGDHVGESEVRRRPFRVSLRSCAPFERAVYTSTPSGEEAPYAIVKAIHFASGAQSASKDVNGTSRRSSLPSTFTVKTPTSSP